MKLFSRLLALLLSLAMLATVACLSVSAVTLFPVGNWVYQKINNNTEFEIYEYKGSNAIVVTPYSHNNLLITTIGQNAFDSNNSLNEIRLRECVTAISNHAFLNCYNLQTVTFMGEFVYYIGNYAFAGCNTLSSINLEDTLINTVSNGMFMNCHSLPEIYIPSTVTTIEKEAFLNCSSLSKVVIPASVTTMEADIFAGSPNVVIHCFSDTTAHNYAVENDIPYVLLDPKETYILGDSDNDSTVTVLDATAIQLYLVSKYNDDDGRLNIRGDVDFDKVVSIMDATRIQQYMAGLLGDDTNIGLPFEY